MKYYLGIDGGGTKTSFTLVDEDFNILKQVVLGPSSIDTVDICDTYNVLQSGINEINHPVDACFAGLGGMASVVDDELITKKLEELLPNAKCYASSDTENALFGALDGEDGICVICGTGSASFGKWNNKAFKAGAYGYLEGDPGSAYSLGFEALRYLARVFDNRLESSDFANTLADSCNCHNRVELVNYFKALNRTNVASLAKVVTSCSNNPYAKKIIEDSVDGLVEEIKAVYNTLDINTLCPFSIIGSLGNADTYFREYLISRLNTLLPNLDIRKYKYNADIGACLKAKSLLK